MENKIRPVIICFSLFMALCMLQTDFMSLGTIVAGITSILTIISAYIGKQTIPFVSNKYAKLLLSFFVLTNLVSLLWGSWPLYYLRYAAQIIVCIVLATLKPINKKEYIFMERVFLISSIVYAVLVIYSCRMLGVSRSIHGDVILFGTAFDPNFIGLIFVAASTIALKNVFENIWRYISVFALLSFVVAILYTASRGSFLSLGLAITLIIIYYTRDSKNSFWTKLIGLGILVVAVYLMTDSVSSSFEDQIARMTSLNDDDSDNGRFELWGEAFRVWEEYPIFGSGLGGMYRINHYATHNTYLELLSECGLIGFLLFMSFLIRILKILYRTDKAYFCMMLSLLFQIMFLDAFDNRCVWSILSWMVLVVNSKQSINYEYYK